MHQRQIWTPNGTISPFIEETDNGDILFCTEAQFSRYYAYQNPDFDERFGNMPMRNNENPWDCKENEVVYITYNLLTPILDYTTDTISEAVGGVLHLTKIDNDFFLVSGSKHGSFSLWRSLEEIYRNNMLLPIGAHAEEFELAIRQQAVKQSIPNSYDMAPHDILLYFKEHNIPLHMEDLMYKYNLPNFININQLVQNLKLWMEDAPHAYNQYIKQK